MKKVCAATITQLTAAAAGAAAAGVPPAPAAQDVMAQLRDEEPARYRELQTLLAKMPQGFALTPVLYTRIAPATNASLESEYVFSVRQRFLKFLGQTQQQALRDMGICDHGIARMARGLDPANKDGDRYAVSVDHIIERNGCGTMSSARARDPQRDDALADAYPVNHFANLLLLPQDVHDYKNIINGLQGIHQMKIGESRWILMLTPVTNDVQHGYVCPPQPANGAFSKLAQYYPSLHQHIAETRAVSTDTVESMQILINDTTAGSILHMLDTLARHSRPRDEGRKKGATTSEQRKLDDKYLLGGFTVADLGVVQPRHPYAAANNNHRHRVPVPDVVVSAPNTLRAIFNAAVSHDRAAQTRVETVLRPRLRELNDLLNTAYSRARVQDVRMPGHKHYADFVEFFRGRNLRGVCLGASHYPLAESRALLETYRRIDRDIKARQRAPKQFKSQKKTG